jgi:hypothetical protein
MHESEPISGGHVSMIFIIPTISADDLKNTLPHRSVRVCE